MRGKEEAFRVLEQALAIASSGVDEAEVSLGGGELASARFEEGEVRGGGVVTHEVLSVRVVTAGRVARHTTSDLTLPGIRDAATQARLRAERLPAPVAFAGLPDPQTYHQGADAFDVEAERLGALDRAAMAARAVRLGLDRRLQASGAVTVRRGGLAEGGRAESYAVANTRGLLAFHPSTRVRFEVRFRGPQGAVGWASDESSVASEVDVDALVDDAARRAAIAGPARALRPGTHPALLEPDAVAELVRVLGATAGAADAAAGASYLSEAGSAPLFDAALTLHDDHGHPCLRGLPFDAEGVARARVCLVRQGSPGAPVSAWATARRLGCAPTGHRTHDPVLGETEAATHLVLDSGLASQEDLVGALGARGVMIRRFDRLEVLDPRRLLVTGTTRDGVLLVEDGEPVAPVGDLRVTFALLDVLRQVRGVGTARWASGAVVPPIALDLPLTPGGVA